MNKNTGDGELDEIVASLVQGVDDAYSALQDGDHREYLEVKDESEKEAKTAIKKYAAQEANKAQQKLLQELMEQKVYIVERAVDKDGKAYPPGYKGSMFVPESVIQNKLEGLS